MVRYGSCVLLVLILASRASRRPVGEFQAASPATVVVAPASTPEDCQNRSQQLDVTVPSPTLGEDVPVRLFVPVCALGQEEQGYPVLWEKDGVSLEPSAESITQTLDGG